jgi:long-chain acyl-CoA synthetase
MVINRIPRNMNQFLNQCFDAASDIPMLGWVNSQNVQTISNQQYKLAILDNIKSLYSLGVRKGCKVAIFGESTPDWHLWDMAIMALGGISVPILPTLSGNDLQIIMNQINPTLILIDDEIHYHKICQVFNHHKWRFLFYIDASFEDQSINENILMASKLDNKNIENSFSEEILEHTQENDIATIIYTSGTTGDPRGAVVTHGALIQMLSNLKVSLRSQISTDDRLLLFLPLSHILGRCNSLLGLLFGIQNIYSQGQDSLYADFQIVKPTIFIGVPRIFEKFQQKIFQSFEKQSSLHRAYFNWANESSNIYYSKIDLDRSPNTSEIIQRNIAYKSVFKNIYEKFGGKVRFFVSGGAPLSTEVSRFLRNCNLLVLEGYGLTETIGACIMSPINKPIIGSVGLPVGDVKLKIDNDGEILIKSKAIFSYYLGHEEDSKSSFTSDGWLKTGDIGHLNSEGQLVILDRKKDLIVTSNGKNIAPQKLENILRKSPLIQEVIVIGDKKPFLTCLILLDKFQCISLLKTDRYTTLSQLCTSKEVVQSISDFIDASNKEISKHEQILNFHLLDEDITDNPYLMSQSLKIRRQHVYQSFKKEIDAMYKSDQSLT